MDITPPVAKEKQLIEGYGNGGFKISGAAYSGSVMVLPERTVAWPVDNIQALSAESFALLFESIPLPEILLIGCGKEHAMIPAALKDLFRQKHIAADTMSTGAACRTYNILLAEGRRVAAALIAV